MVGKAKLFTGRKEKASTRDVSVKSVNNSLFQSNLFSSEKKNETRDFLERSWKMFQRLDYKYERKNWKMEEYNFIQQ
ncbi:hypothetical protein BpHYR1_034324 [Brachionus plicatilis]|uniref:Uncharacterized protein n=1 Tax=Brachionus plicatilis TaxID=10195 RepID=A0A3M7RV18_BRAPC|nr:hypothetical protein BpHYR1_034324 [Brachionus plicatilis]